MVENGLPRLFPNRSKAAGMRERFNDALGKFVLVEKRDQETVIAIDKLAHWRGVGTDDGASGAQRKDGSRFWASVSITPLRDDSGELRGFSKVTRDITERKKAEALISRQMKVLSRSNEELEQFAAVASHDLQEPLRMVSSYVQLLSRQYKGKLDGKADEFIALALDGTVRMRTLISDPLTYSKVAAKHVELHTTSSEKTLQNALVNLQGAIADSHASVTHDPLPAVMADEMQLTQLFQNLVGNAIKYQKDGTPKIHISAAVDGDGRWDFSVQDNGIGIDPKNFERVFGMFQRLHTPEEFRRHGHRPGALQKDCRAARRQHFSRVASRSGINLSFLFGRLL
jgi:light-regulated signal transduction histidine kinase (bacteriophytochrome)